VSKLSAPMPDFPVVKLPEETNDRFRARVELAAANVVGRYTRGEHKVCIEVLLNRGRVNGFFSTPMCYTSFAWSLTMRQVRKLPRKGSKTPVPGPWRNVRGCPVGRRPLLKPWWRRLLNLNWLPGLKSCLRPTFRRRSCRRRRLLCRVAVTMTSPRAGVLKISVETKRPGAAPSPATKGKQARLDVGPPLISTAPLKVSTRP
jgi:hypothetical protein